MSRFGEVVESSNDKGPHKLIDVESEGKRLTVQVQEQDGVSSNPLVGSICTISDAFGDSGFALATVNAPPGDRVDGLKPGEKVYKNHATGNSIKHSADGNTTITTSGDTIIKSSGIVHINPS